MDSDSYHEKSAQYANSKNVLVRNLTKSSKLYIMILLILLENQNEELIYEMLCRRFKGESVYEKYLKEKT